MKVSRPSIRPRPSTVRGYACMHACMQAAESPACTGYIGTSVVVIEWSMLMDRSRYTGILVAI